MLQNYTTLKVLQVFFYSPTKKHYLKEISKECGVAHTSVKKILDLSIKENIIIKEIERKGNREFPLYKANIEDKEYKKIKKISNLINIENSGLIKHLKDTLMPKTIILFGSYARGEDTEDSDIDIFIETKKPEILQKKYEKILKRKIELHFKENFKDYPDELKNNIINGIVLDGFLGGY